jgi:hypothetical protein
MTTGRTIGVSSISRSKKKQLVSVQFLEARRNNWKQLVSVQFLEARIELRRIAFALGSFGLQGNNDPVTASGISRLAEGK